MNIVYFSPIPYDFLMQRPQYLAAELSKLHKVTYIEPTISPIRWALKGGESPLTKSRQIKENLNVVRLNGVLTAPHTLNAFDFGLNLQWELGQLRNMFPSIDMVWIGYPGWWPLVSRLKYKRLVYDRMDNCSLMVSNKMLSKQLYKNDIEVMTNADCVFASAKSLFDESSAINKHTYLIPNAVAEDFARNVVSAVTNRQQHMNLENDSAHGCRKKVFGYVGMIDSWFDIDAVAAIVESCKEHEIVLVGPNNILKLKHPQVKYVGRVPKSELPALICVFDVCLYPFKQNKLLDTINPVKIYEYLALNKPVLAVESKETRTFGDLVVRYNSYDKLTQLSIQQFLPPFASDETRNEFVADNKWSKRGKEILTVLNNL